MMMKLTLVVFALVLIINNGDCKSFKGGEKGFNNGGKGTS